MIVRIPSPLRSYTGNKSEVLGSGLSVAQVLQSLDVQYAGIRFRMIDEQDCIRKHIKIFINSVPVNDLSSQVKDDDTIHIICALSGG